MESPLSMSQRLAISFGTLVGLTVILVTWEQVRSEVVIRDQKVVVVNHESVENIDRLFHTGDECILRPHGEVARHFFPRDVVLMEYRAPEDKPPTEHSCPSGTLFLGELHQD